MVLAEAPPPLGLAVAILGMGANEPGQAVDVSGHERWTPSTGQLINGAKWNLLRYIPVKMRGAEDDKEEAAQSFASV